MKVLVLGGDCLNLRMIEFFKQQNIKVDYVGFDLLFGDCLNINDIALYSYDIILFPLHGINWDFSIDCPYNRDKLYIPPNFLNSSNPFVNIYSGYYCDMLDKMASNYMYTNLIEEPLNKKTL